MPGTKVGGMKAAMTNKTRFGEDFYARIGKKGGGGKMSVSLTEVINSAGYDPEHNVEDARWLFAQFDDYEELSDKAQNLLDDYEDYEGCCAMYEELGVTDIGSFEEWRQNETI